MHLALEQWKVVEGDLKQKEVTERFSIPAERIPRSTEGNPMKVFFGQFLT